MTIIYINIFRLKSIQQIIQRTPTLSIIRSIVRNSCLPRGPDRIYPHRDISQSSSLNTNQRLKFRQQKSHVFPKCKFFQYPFYLTWIFNYFWWKILNVQFWFAVFFVFRNQSHDGPLQHHSIRSSNSHQNIPPLEALHADQGSYQSSRERERLGRDGNKSAEQPYSMYVYQQWAKMNPEAAANLEPSQAADLFNRAVKVRVFWYLANLYDV